MMYKKLILFIVFISFSFSVSAKSFNTLKVTSVSLNSQQCLNYKITGQCIYLYLSCSLFGGCSLKTKLRDRIKHNLPDLVVSAFREPGDQPYTEAKLLYSTPAVMAMQTIANSAVMGHMNASGGSTKLSTKQGNNDRLKFNEVNIVGNPAVNTVRAVKKYTVPFINGGPYLCKSSSEPLKPYFMSELDILAWRTSILNINSASLIPGQREISSGSNAVQRALQTWGSIHPRIGFVMQTDAVKAAAVVAQRAIDITTQSFQVPHVYTPYGYIGKRSIPDNSYPNAQSCLGYGGSNGGNDNQWTQDQYCLASLPNTPDWDLKTDEEKQQFSDSQCPRQCIPNSTSVQWLRGADETQKAWQMITPITSNSCEAFGSNDDWAVGKEADDGQYGFNFWREYECCKPGPGWLIYP